MQELEAHSSLRERLTAWYREDESHAVRALLEDLELSPDTLLHIQDRANQLATKVRQRIKSGTAVDAFMQQYQLSSHEGIVMMCLAEALLRVPDIETAQALIADKLGQADFTRHLNASSSRLVNSATRALNWAAELVNTAGEEDEIKVIFRKLLARSSEPFIRQGAYQAMRLLADKFVMSSNIDKALKRAKKESQYGYTHSFDMLGEAALTTPDAQRYFREYRQAIRSIAAYYGGQDHMDGHSISIKLSALYPRYEFAKHDAVMDELYNPLLILCQEAKAANIALTIDAEEAARLELSLDLFEKLSGDPSLSNWNGLGMAVQAYQKRAPLVIDWLAELANRHQRRINVRLVKGAYWDTEIKLSQVNGYTDYPVFTRKSSTDLSFIVCAQKLLANPTAFYPAFATHNAHTIATIMTLADGTGTEYEFQKLHGMGDALYDCLMDEKHPGFKCRVYAPVGNYKDLLPYLVRRLLENGANSSFINKIGDENVDIATLNEDPYLKTQTLTSIPHPAIPLPENLYGNTRLNSRGLDTTDSGEINPVLKALKVTPALKACSIIGGQERCDTQPYTAYSPFDNTVPIGEVYKAEPDDIRKALDQAFNAFEKWRCTSIQSRAAILMRMADLMEEKRLELIRICVYENGKTIQDAVAEIREAIDFCRYYAVNGCQDFGQPHPLQGPTGEQNQLQFTGRGVFVCISPWNFPLAIFLGQVTAALMAGNTVIAKPAGQTPFIASYAVRLLLEAGVPPEVLHLVVASGHMIHELVLKDPRIAGVAFTGSTETAWSINQALARKRGPIIPFIAETGGQNVMLADSTALIEQLTGDVIASAFQSAGQRCSALRVLLIQEDIADHFIDTLKGAMDHLAVGNPTILSTDIGPVIDQASQKELGDYCNSLRTGGTLLHETPIKAIETDRGSFIAPVAFEIPDLQNFTTERFGPILHVLRYQASYLDQVIDHVNGLGYGLTFGLHTRIDKRVKEITERIKVGNVYVNRNMIGAVVGVQPFGGYGLSGTGPKAGGPYYLHRFAAEKTVSINTTAQGGNTSLMTLKDE